jgi:hypothetical protein
MDESEKLYKEQVEKAKKDLNCAICDVLGSFRSLHVPSNDYANYWMCRECGDKYIEDLKKWNEEYFKEKN